MTVGGYSVGTGDHVAFLIARLEEDESGHLVVKGLGIFSESCPSATSRGTWANLVDYRADSFSEAEEKLRAYVKHWWPWLVKHIDRR